ncbi:acyl-CoA thioesterase [Yaniella halotolerans]|uniref:acyl-CoA thioesterase n=1 Tax=Yaniella halotolerans TaxID=225453 RepID=UPI0003B4B171|nr:thioesterase family protein [Yaniella halotolerans]
MIVLEIPLRWGDMDAYGHINNVQIVRLMEEARVLAFGIPSGTGTLDATTPKPHVNLLAGVGDSVMTLIAEHTVKYRRQLPYRGVPVRVEVGVDKVKGASVEVSYAFYDGDDIAVSATSTMVFVGQESGRPVRLSEQQRAEVAKLK